MIFKLDNFYGFESGSLTTFLNPYSYMLLRKQKPHYLDDGVFKLHADGISLVGLYNLFSSEKAKRYSFDDSSIAADIFSYCAAHGVTVAFVGSLPGVVGKAKVLLENNFEGLNVIYTQDGYFSAEQKPAVLMSCLEVGCLVVSMGTPLQEDFLLELRAEGWGGTGFTCGGYFDQLVSVAGAAYYPAWVDRCNIRWLYRLYKEPRRLWRRYLVDYPQAILVFIWDMLRSR